MHILKKMKIWFIRKAYNLLESHRIRVFLGERKDNRDSDFPSEKTQTQSKFPTKVAQLHNSRNVTKISETKAQNTIPSHFTPWASTV